MSHRLQVLLDDSEFREIKRIAGQNHMTVAEWVRQALRAARREAPIQDTDRKIAAVREAMRHGFPTADIEMMLREVESGYLPSDGE